MTRGGTFSRAFVVTAITIGLLSLGVGAIVAQSGNDLFQQALVKERTDGDISAAIALYESIVQKHSTDRALVAKALVQIGQCYEKLGQSDALKAYERVVREFADQTESLSTARARLSALTSSPAATPGPGTRLLWNDYNFQWSYDVGAPSADGRYISFAGDDDELYVRDLRAGVSHRLTFQSEKNPEDVAESLVSPDGRYVAYGWDDMPGFELRMLPVSGQRAEPKVLHSSGETDYMRPVGWTPNGASLLVLRTLKDRTGQIAFLSTADGSLRVLKSPRGWDQLGKVSLSPDGRFVVYSGPAGPGVPAHDIFVLAADGSRETVVVQSPAEDREPVWSPDGSQILFVSNRTGGRSLWSIRVEAGKPASSPEHVRTDVGRLLGMTRSGGLYYVMGGSTSNIYTVDLGATMKVTGTRVLATDRFVNGNSDPKWSRDGQQLAYRRGSTIVIRSLTTGDERTVLTELRAAQLTGWFPDGRSLLVLSLDVESRRTNFHKLDTTNGGTELLLSVKPHPIGISRFRPDLSPDGKSIFYIDPEDSDDSVQVLKRFDIGSRGTDVMRPVEIIRSHRFSSIAVSPDGTQLASWLASSEDRDGGWLTVLPVGGGEPLKLIRREPNEDVRGELAWTPDQRHLLFVSDTNDAAQSYKLVRVPVAGGEREEMGPLSSAAQFVPLTLHPDGRRITYQARDERPWELWALENFLSQRRAAK